MTPSKLIFSLKPSPTAAILLVVLGGVVMPTVPSHAIALSVPDASVVVLDPAPPVAAAAEPVVVSPAVPLQVESAEVFVDKTDYSLGATKQIGRAHV